MTSAKSKIIRLIALDLDGTLLTSHKQITPETRDALLHLSAAGTHIVLASARPPRGVRPFYQALGLSTPQVNYNGAAVYDEPKRAFTHHQPIAPDDLARLIESVDALLPRAIYSIEHLDRWITHDHQHEFLMETAKLAPPDLLIDKVHIARHPATKLMLHAPAADIDGLPKSPEFLRNLRVYRTDPFLVQFVHRSCSKAAALRLICQQLDIPMSQVFAMGDADNDIDMLEQAGLSAAVAHAPAEVRQAATFTTTTNDQNGVLNALKQADLV
jgi:Cof subfamily protein (haloacid dehalogenase superfamily)